MRPRFAKIVSPNNQRAQGMPGARCAHSLACKIKQAYELVTTVTPEIIRHSPRNGFTAYFALSSVTTLFDTVACASSHRLDANDWGVGTTRLRRPRQHNSSSAPPASTASRPTLMTCATPLLSERDVRINELIWVGRKQKYFCKRGLTPFLKIRSDLPVGQNICGIPGWRRVGSERTNGHLQSTPAIMSLAL